jgi:tetratricopeptide (TPR) repeat protein
LALLFFAAPHLARAENKKAEARTHYEAGMRKFDVGKYDEAAEEFQAAYELVGDPVILYNIAQSFRLGQRYEKAIQFYKSFLRRMGATPNRAEVEKRIAELEELTGQRPTDHVEPKSEPRAKVEPKNEPKNEPKVEPKNENPPDTGETKPENGEKTGEDAPRRGLALKVAGFGLGGLAVASLAVGISMSVLASNASKAVEKAAAGQGPFTADLHTTESHGKVYDTTGIVMYCAAGLFAAGSAVSLYFAFRPEAEKPAQPGETAQPSAKLVPVLSPTGGGLSVVGRF